MFSVLKNDRSSMIKFTVRPGFSSTIVIYTWPVLIGENCRRPISLVGINDCRDQRLIDTFHVSTTISKKPVGLSLLLVNEKYMLNVYSGGYWES